MMAQPPAASTIGAFSSIPSSDSILAPQLFAQVATQISSFASKGAILNASLAWWKVRILNRSEEHTSELQSLMRISYAVFCLNKKKRITNYNKIIKTNEVTYVSIVNSND